AAVGQLDGLPVLVDEREVRRRADDGQAGCRLPDSQEQATGQSGNHGLPQFSSMSCPRAGPVGKPFRSTWKSASSFIPSGAMWASFTQNFAGRSIVLSSELVMYIRLPSPVTCIMLGCSPGLRVLCSFGFFRSLTSHCWTSSDAKQLTNRYLSSG